MSQYQKNNDVFQHELPIAGAAPEIDDEPSVRIDEMRELQLEMIDVAQTHAELAFDFVEN